MKENTTKKQISDILIMYSELKAVFDSVIYEGNNILAKLDVSFKGFFIKEEQEYSELSDTLIQNFSNGIYIRKEAVGHKMLPVYTAMLKRFNEKGVVQFSTRENLQSRNEKISLIILLKDNLSS